MIKTATPKQNVVTLKREPTAKMKKNDKCRTKVASPTKEEILQSGGKKDTASTPRFPFTSSFVLDMVRREDTTKKTSDMKSRNVDPSEAIKTNMLAAVKSVTMHRSQPLKRISTPKPSIPQMRLPQESGVRNGITPVRYATTTLPSASNNDKGKGPSKPKTARVIRNERDIRQQLLSSFSAVAAAKGPKFRTSPPANTAKTSNIHAPNIPCKSSLTQDPLLSPRFRFPRFSSSYKPLKQNIAFADPSRKVAVSVESMLSSAITKVMKAQIPSFSSQNSNSQPTSDLHFKRTLRRRPKRRHRSQDDDNYDDEDTSDLDDEKPWEAENNEGSDNSEEIERCFGDYEVKMETCSDESEIEYDDSSRPLRIATHQFVDENDDDVELEEHIDQDPLAMEHSIDDVETSQPTAVKMEPLCGDSIDIEQHENGSYDTTFMEGEYENEETGQLSPDVKPQVIDPAEINESTVNIVRVETITGELLESLKTERLDSNN